MILANYFEIGWTTIEWCLEVLKNCESSKLFLDWMDYIIEWCLEILKNCESSKLFKIGWTIITIDRFILV